MATKTWTGGSGTNWNPGGWTPSGLPGSGDDVVIAQGSPAITSDVGTVDSVTIDGGGLVMADGALATTGDFSTTCSVGSAWFPKS